MATLYLIATPIGNLEDISLRALRLLRSVRLIACEDTRHSARLLRHYEIKTPTISYHAHNERTRLPHLIAALAEGDLALISDAGTPAIADPGYRLVEAAKVAGYPVVPVPGASALLAAVVGSGLVPEGFTFIGFLPRRPTEARRRLADYGALAHPLVLYEAPHRLVATLSLLYELLGDRPAVVARELTKLHEEFRRERLSALLAHYQSQAPRGECVLIIAADDRPSAVNDTTAAEAVKALLATGQSPSQAARLAAHQTGRPRAELYALAMAYNRPRQATDPSPGV